MYPSFFSMQVRVSASTTTPPPQLVTQDHAPFLPPHSGSTPPLRSTQVWRFFGEENFLIPSIFFPFQLFDEMIIFIQDLCSLCKWRGEMSFVKNESWKEKTVLNDWWNIAKTKWFLLYELSVAKGSGIGQNVFLNCFFKYLIRSVLKYPSASSSKQVCLVFGLQK